MSGNSFLQRLLRDSRAVAAIEFAIVAPLLVLLFAGAVELTRYVLANQKVDKAANALSDFVSQLENPKAVNMNALKDTFDQLMVPYGSKDAEFIVTVMAHAEDAEKDSDPIRVDFQEKRGGLSYASKVGSLGGPPNDVAKGLGIQIGEQLVSVEVYYKHQNILSNAGKISEALDFEDDEPLYKVAYFRQRLVPGDENEPGKAQKEPNVFCCGKYCREDLDAKPPILALPPCACGHENKCVPQEVLDVLEQYSNNDPALAEQIKFCDKICEEKDDDSNWRQEYCADPANKNLCICGNQAACPTGGEVQP